eukprot:TRINITY_DN1745_c0_g1_i8.p1 TRINITY_DN1745_c0_g1~~TRINITY_DN1745_c0_g1_i8.p1  ORF type:complete len:300 (+),score=129.02 TRINITY_DN1745_c0_g1_i8:311-1210(+)
MLQYRHHQLLVLPPWLLPRQWLLQQQQQQQKEEEDAEERKEGTEVQKDRAGGEISGQPDLGQSHDLASSDVDAIENMPEKEKRLFSLRLKLNQARMANQAAIVAEKKREEQQRHQPEEGGQGISKRRWFEEQQRKIGRQLEANGLTLAAAHQLETQEQAEAKYKKWEKKSAAFGWDVFNQKSLYKAYEKRTKAVVVDMADYQAKKEELGAEEFYRDGASLQYGKPMEVPKENVDRMVEELQHRTQKRKEFSRRRKFYDEKDIDSINERNQHFNRKIERAFGKYTVEIKNNLERGTALPD